MESLLDKLNETAAFLAAAGIVSPTVGVVLGTGLGELAHHIEIEKTIPYHGIPNFPVSTVEFHKGNLIWGKIGTTSVLAMQGRFHYYEGLPPASRGTPRRRRSRRARRSGPSRPCWSSSCPDRRRASPGSARSWSGRGSRTLTRTPCVAHFGGEAAGVVDDGGLERGVDAAVRIARHGRRPRRC